MAELMARIDVTAEVTSKPAPLVADPKLSPTVAIAPEVCLSSVVLNASEVPKGGAVD
jgi:hypothetical protein